MVLQGKVAIVTGAGRGFGNGIARALGQAGAYVYVTDINEAELAQTAVEMRADGSLFTTQMLDVRELVAFQALAKHVVASHGRIDIFIHCAAIMPRITFAQTSPTLWQRELDINLGGFLNGVHAVWDQMVAQGGGHLTAVASGASTRGFGDEAVYCAGKHALEGFIKSLAFEAAPHNIAVNSVGPGKIIKPTGINRTSVEAIPAAEQAKWTKSIQLGKAFVWLATQSADQVTGLRLDAGPIVDTIAAEGFNFAFAPEKVTLYTEDLVARQRWWQAYNHSNKTT